MYHDSIFFSGEGGDFVGWQGESQSNFYLQLVALLYLKLNYWYCMRAGIVTAYYSIDF